MHGYLSNGKSFYNQLDFFAKDYNVYAPDLKGFGENAVMEHPYSLDDYIQSVKEYMVKNSIIRPHVIAHSFGARIVIKGCAKDNSLFNKIVLTGGAGLKPKDTLKKRFKRATFNIFKHLVSKDRLKGFYSSDYLALSPIMQQSFIKIVNEHLDDYLPKISNKTLLIFGKNDKQTPLYMANKLNKNLPNSELKIFDNAGHFAFIDCPMKFNLEVKEFLLS